MWNLFVNQKEHLIIENKAEPLVPLLIGSLNFD